ncbi:MAG: YabP/YqfC family sporulation protein [Clostridia bacterium]|nr:YabP/YqfC family sporulation protein [Clostridia bacterium]
MANRPAKRGHKPFCKTLLSLFTLPACILPGVPYMELQGDASIAITGYEALLFYEEHSILFRMKDPTAPHFTLLRITGENLTLSVLREGCLCVRGRIDAVILHPKDVGVGGA